MSIRLEALAKTAEKKAAKGRPRRSGKGSYRSGAAGVVITERNKVRRLLKHIKRNVTKGYCCEDAIDAFLRYGGKPSVVIALATSKES